MFLPTEDFTAIKNTITLTPKEGICDSAFLYYLLDSVILPKRGTGQPFISKGDIQKFPISIPPLDEQKRIVAVLDQAFVALERARAYANANQADTKELFNRTVTRLFGREGVETVTIGKVCEIRSGAGFPHKYQGRTAGQFPFYKVSDMNLPGNEWELRHANNYIDESTRKRLRASVLPTDAIVFPKVGGAIATNKKRAIKTAGCVDNNVMGLIANRDQIDPAYLHEWLYATDIYEFSNKANPPSITQTTVRDWPMPVPSKAEQCEIVDEIKAMRQSMTMLREAYKAGLEALAELRQSILQKAFSGQL